ncbi:hypothetical protein R3P38DRAFT_3267567 [Favolaschia claudopus]|uniref:Uncharacterized protein n=1 Tax=Favolaschia claudopus TaxID=2862362 RepID=A0AAW0BRK8_9AGAR
MDRAPGASRSSRKGSCLHLLPFHHSHHLSSRHIARPPPPRLLPLGAYKFSTAQLPISSIVLSTFWIVWRSTTAGISRIRCPLATLYPLDRRFHGGCCPDTSELYWDLLEYLAAVGDRYTAAPPFFLLRVHVPCSPLASRFDITLFAARRFRPHHGRIFAPVPVSTASPDSRETVRCYTVLISLIHNAPRHRPATFPAAPPPRAFHAFDCRRFRHTPPLDITLYIGGTLPRLLRA